jgi:hypothetical protein
MKSDDSGQLSLDFLAGFTIFLIGFIFVITMASGLLVGLQSRTIDYDAVAYRTGVILVEDPGYGRDPGSVNNTTSWEFIPSVDKEDIFRIGLAVTKNAPNILSDEKVAQFFNSSKFTSSEIHNKVIFDTAESGLYSSLGFYRYNINLTYINLTSMNSTPYGPPIGDIIPPNTNTGYIRRVVKIKQPIDIFRNESVIINPSPNGTSVYFDFPSLNSVQQPYRIDPLKGTTRINISNFNGTLSGVKLYYDYPPLLNETGDTLISDVPYQWNATTKTVTTELNPGFFTEREVDPGRWGYHIKFLSNATGNRYIIDTNSLPGQPTFVPAVLEVRIW